MRMLRWMTGNRLRDRIKNVCIRKKSEIALIKDKMEGTGQNGFSHVANTNKCECDN